MRLSIQVQTTSTSNEMIIKQVVPEIGWQMFITVSLQTKEKP